MKKIVSSLLVSIIIMMTCIVSNAANVANLVFTSNSTSVDVGSEITIYLEVSSLSGISDLYGMAGVLDYDQDTFELVSVTGENGWQVTKGNIISMLHSDGVTSGKIIKVVLKALKKPENGSTAVTLKQVSVTDNIEEYEQADVSYTINIKDNVVNNPADETPETNEGTNSGSTNNGPTNQGTNQNTNQGTTQNGNSTNDNTISKVKLPATGLDVTVTILIALAVIIGVASLIRYKKIELK